MVHRRRGDVIAKKATTIAIVNQKGGTAKTTTCENLGIGLAMEGKKVLLVDVDPQGSLTISMGWQQPDELSTTLSTLMQKAMNDQPIQPGEGILHHAEGVDLIPANIELAGMEVALVNSMNREKMLKQVLDSAKREYDYPHYGSEQGGKRPVIIIQNDVGIKFAPTVIVAAVTSRISKKPNQPTHVLIDKNPAFSRPSVVLLEQIFTIDKERINNFMGLTSEWEMKQIEEALLKSLGINK